MENILVTAYEKFKQKANLGCSVTKWNSDSLSIALNACYQDNKNIKENLYNGYLVVKIDEVATKSPVTPLEGKFIIIIDNNIEQQLKLPPTTANSFVVLYLLQGSKAEITVANDGEGAVYNYFIYTKADMGSIMFNNAILSGSVYADADDCAKASDIKARRLDYNEDLMVDLVTNEILCDASVGESGCGGTVLSSSSADGSSSSNADIDVVNVDKDRFFISMAPQLGVTLESQNRSRESLPPLRLSSDKPDLDSSFIVLPRMVSLPDDPYGALEDYIKVIPLNGGHEIPEAMLSIGCSAMPGTSGSLSITSLKSKLYTPGGSKLPHGFYKCYIESELYRDFKMPLWLIVGDSYRAVPEIKFTSETQEIGSSAVKTVNVFVPAHDQDIDLNVFCPTIVPDNWTYETLPENLGSAPNCTFRIEAKPGSDTTIALFSVTTSSAVNGTLTFQIMPGEYYNLGNPFVHSVSMASKATLRRNPATQEDIQAYCNAHAEDCPEDINNWPNCDVDEEWVKPQGTAAVPSEYNDLWTISVGGTGSLKLVPVSSGNCVIIIPDESLNIEELEPANTYYLRASAKTAKRDFKLKYVGDVGAGNNPVVQIYLMDRLPVEVVDCPYRRDTSVTICSVNLYGDEKVALHVDKDLKDNEQFSYWKCRSGSCSTTGWPVTSEDYEPFVVNKSGTLVEAHFGENDKHCFFEEFKNRQIRCDLLDDATTKKYCIDYCGNNPSSDTCLSADGDGEWFTNAKWHLIYGRVTDIKNDSNSGAISVKPQKDVIVMSTVGAGRAGTLKAVVHVPRVGSSVGATTGKIRDTGFLLRSKNDASSYLMLNAFADNQNKLATMICLKDGSCLVDRPLHEGSPMSVSETNMMMITAVLTRTDSLYVSAYEGNYYGSPTVYETAFDLSNLESSNNMVDFEYVGYRLTHADFLIYGIGWISEEYGQECHETPPMVKCSFAARTIDGVIPTDTLVKPWVGHSGWFDSHEHECQTKYYYYNGTDACSGRIGTSTACSDDGFYFAKEGSGKHGYRESVNDTLTAKATIRCMLDGVEGLWGADANDEEHRAHCGTFWTGKFTNCRVNEALSTSDVKVYANSEGVITFDQTNMRSAALKITMDNPSNSEVEVWLSSGADWYGGEMHPSIATTMTGTSGEFDVVELFSSGAGGFNPEKVVQVGFFNKGPGNVTIKTVNSACSEAVGVSSCSAKREGGTWTITADIEKIENVTNYEISGRREDKGPAHDNSADLTPLSFAANEVLQNDGKVTLTYPMDEIKPGQYSFAVSVSSDNNATKQSKSCTVDQHEVHEVSCTTKITGNTVIALDGESSVESPMFQFEINHCPPAKGCGSYVVKLGNEVVTNGSGSCPGEGALPHEREKCGPFSFQGPAQSNAETYYYTVVSTESPERFTCESKSFTLVSSSSAAAESSSSDELLVECSIADQTGKTAGDNIEVTPHSVTGCNAADCSYEVTADHVLTGATGSTYNGGAITFSDAGGSGTENYTLTISHGTASAACNFSVTYASSSSSSSDLNIVCDIDNTEIELGDFFKINVSATGGSGNEQASDCSLEGNGVLSGGNCNYLWNYGSDIKITPSSTGNLQYVYSFKLSESGAVLGTYSCKWDVSVKAGSAILLSTDFRSYSAGSYTVKTGTVGSGIPDILHCKAATVNYDRTIGKLGSCTIKIPANNDKSNGNGCSVTSNGTYTFEVNADPPSDLTCGLSY